MRKYLLSTFLCFSGIVSVFGQVQEPKQKHFTNKDKKFNDWSISIFGGANALQNSDLVSWYDTDFKQLTPGYQFKFQVNKQITHAFGLSLQYEYGKTRQKGKIMDEHESGYSGIALGRTQYHGVSVLGDLNLSNLLRRVDNTSPFNWALHAYAGVGFLGYDAKRDNYWGSGSNLVTVTKQDIDDKSFYAQVGWGLRRKLSKRFDVEFRNMYIITGDDEFDASGKKFPGYWTAADREESVSDNLITVSLGLHYKFGKHPEALQWYSPISSATTVVNGEPKLFECVDKDNDGVCDQWDKCLDTPEGAKVDGSGCTLDSDGDGIPDSEDKCPTIAGPLANGGCPEKLVRISGADVATIVTRALEGVDFNYNSDVIREVSYVKLNNAAEVLLANPDLKFSVEGHTDAAGGAEYNLKLSERRANSVIRYLVNKGVNPANLVAVGMGKSDLKWPECNPVTSCPPWKNLENRRVVFKEIQ